MKTIINYLKRTCWFNVSVAFITCVFLLALPSCQKDNQDPMIKMDNMSPSASSKKIKLTGKVKDVEKNWYKTVKIGEQWWMAENLKTTKYRNGDLIGTTTPATLDIFYEVTPKYQWAYDGNESNVDTYGRLYTWYAVTDIRNVCPKGWHLPSDAEWTTLITYLGGELVAGGKLKEIGTTHWRTPNEGATNETGFTALPSGYRDESSMFYNIGYYGTWWSSSESSATNAYCRSLSYYYSYGITTYYFKYEGASVRCLKDN